MLKRLPLFLALTGCGDAFAPPANAYPFTPPDSLYAAYWQQMETCSGRTGDWRRITWYVVPGEWIDHPDNSQALGVWESPHTIYLLERIALRPSSWVIPHEMLHDLLQTGTHPPAFEVCGVR